MSLKRRVRELEEENKKLKEEIAYLKFELQELKDKIYKKKSGREDPPTVQAPPKKRGAPLGHLGWFRKKPDLIDEIVEVELPRCPVCGGSDLCDTGRMEEHIQEDIVFPKSEAVCYRKKEYYCPSCKEVVLGVGQGELPGSFIGPLAKSVAAHLKYAVKVSDRDIQKIFKSLFGLKMTVSAIPGFRNQMAKRLGPVHEHLKESLKKTRWLHADETGWRVDGKNRWLWSFSGKRISVCHIDPSRGQGVPEAILGPQYKGVLVSDFLSAYNKIKARAKQRCLVHLLRELKRVKECLHEDDAVVKFCARLENLVCDAVELGKARRHRRIPKDEFERRRGAIASALSDLKFHDPKHKILRRFVKRLERHKEELLTFLDYPEVDFHNNRAERQIRPNVLLRKITFGNRSERGVQNHNILMSIIQTAKLAGIDPLERLKKLLLDSAKPRSLATLSPP